MNGIELIAEERQRQIEVEGFSSERDDAYTDGQLARAAAAFVHPGGYYEREAIWPKDWDKSWLKIPAMSPEDRRRELVKAGALIAAELDRLQRANEKSNA